MQDLINKAKKKIKEDVEFQLVPEYIEDEMQKKGVLAQYDFNNDIIYYSNTLIKSKYENLQIQTFVHELAHAKDLRTCVRNGLLKVLEPHQPPFKIPWLLLNDILHSATEFQVSNFLNTKFGYQLPSNYFFERSLHEPLPLSLIPAIEYLHFGKDSKLRDQFRIKLSKLLDSKLLCVDSLLLELGFANAQSFETGFLRLAYCFGYDVNIKIKPNEGEIKKSFRFLQNSNNTQIKVFEMINWHPIN
ncbi:MAG: hypothetical protein IBX39_02850 [Candidatus Methanoperedenaceae archaeon]|nr:hypothetical protein [Candidatus Methanoperedenaceae archaeon]